MGYHLTPLCFCSDSFFDAALNLDLEFFTEGGDLAHLLRAFESDPLMHKFAGLNRALAEVIEDFPFVAFHTLYIDEKESVIRLMRAIDKSNGYIFEGVDASKVLYKGIVGKQERDPRWTLEVQERYMKQ